MTQINQTKDYAMFKTIYGNRPISKKSVDRIADSIAEYGLMNPILINENGEVLDGQHRLEACKKLGIPVKYIVSDYNETIETVQSINSTQRSWLLVELIQSLADNGNSTCKWVMLQRKYHPWIKFSIITDILGIRRNNARNFFLNLEERSRIERKFEYFDRYEKWFGRVGGSQKAFLQVIGFLYDHPLVDNDRLFTVLDKVVFDFLPCTSADAVARQIESAYNKGLSNKLSLAVDYQNYKATIKKNEKR